MSVSIQCGGLKDDSDECSLYQARQILRTFGPTSAVLKPNSFSSLNTYNPTVLEASVIATDLIISHQHGRFQYPTRPTDCPCPSAVWNRQA